MTVCLTRSLINDFIWLFTHRGFDCDYSDTRWRSFISPWVFGLDELHHYCVCVCVCAFHQFLSRKQSLVMLSVLIYSKCILQSMHVYFCCKCE